MDEYFLIRGLMSLTLILSILYTSMVLKMLGQYMEKGRQVIFVQITGSFLVVFAFILMGFKDISLEGILAILLALIGAFLIIYPLIKYRLGKFSKINATQIILVILSSVFGHLVGFHWIVVLKTVGILSLLLLIQSLNSIKLTDPLLRTLLDVSLWLLVIYAWLGHLTVRYIGSCNYYLIHLIYFTALLLWLFSAVVSYDHVRRWL
ncbi:MAG: hypothetical protein H0Z18_00505 [Thermococcus sp.]|uniref:hypothetical protein n=1 Tax=Thermococcus sp. TaxID=35749 RepID=UPI001DCA2313|nr:hypothetical protein [Thermococcus sp.]MBO8173716.1 hypothetical protein [Thermococcus sp.]